MGKLYNVGILGCGDFLRWQSDALEKSSRIVVKALYDPEKSRAEKYAAKLKGNAVNNTDVIFRDKSIDIVCIFVPPWIRKNLVIKAAEAGKHIITTKPLGPNDADCAAMVKATEWKVKCGVYYGRTGNAVIETYKKIFDGGEIGRLALYKQDWIHHYPEWNQWATDPKKNGGPFMDAMIHNMNVARYLMKRKATYCTYFSDNYAQNLKCNDTEFMKLDFEGNGSAYLFITWAADLAVYSKQGNDREHIDIRYMITDEGWRLTNGLEGKSQTITASKDGKIRKWIVRELSSTSYDEFADMLDNNKDMPSDIPDIREAYEDIKLLIHAEKNHGTRFKVEMS